MLKRLALGLVSVMFISTAFGNTLHRSHSDGLPFDPPFDFPELPLQPLPIDLPQGMANRMVRCVVQNDTGYSFDGLGYGRYGIESATNAAMAKCRMTSDYCRLVGCSHLSISM